MQISSKFYPSTISQITLITKVAIASHKTTTEQAFPLTDIILNIQDIKCVLWDDEIKAMLVLNQNGFCKSISNNIWQCKLLTSQSIYHIFTAKRYNNIYQICHTFIRISGGKKISWLVGRYFIETRFNKKFTNLT